MKIGHLYFEICSENGIYTCTFDIEVFRHISDGEKP